MLLKDYACMVHVQNESLVAIDLFLGFSSTCVFSVCSTSALSISSL